MVAHADDGRMTVSNPKSVVRQAMKAFADELETRLVGGGKISRRSDDTSENFYTKKVRDTVVFLIIEGSEVASYLDLIFTPQGGRKAVTYRWSGNGSLWHLQGGTTSRSGGNLLDELARLFG